MKGEEKHLIISSPSEDFIKTLYSQLNNIHSFEINKKEFVISDIKVFDIKLKNKFITASPIVLYKNSKTGEFFKFYKNLDNFDFFLNRLKDNAIKKYNSYYKTNFNLEGEIFDKLMPRVRNGRIDIYTKISKKGRDFFIVGSSWKLLEKTKINKEEAKFYKFIMDCGLGEKNSLGFGFLNPLK